MSNAAGAIFLRAFSKALGEGSSNPFANSNDVAIATVDDLIKLKLDPGQRFEFRYGRVDYRFRLVKAKAALAQGDILKANIGGAGRTANVTSSTKAIVTSDGSLTASELGGGLAFLNAGTDAPEVRFIRDNSGDVGASTVTVSTRDMAHNIDATATPDAFTTTPDATSKLTFYTPWEVTKHATIADPIVGIALNTVTSGNYTVILEKGPCLVTCVGTVDALVANRVIVPSATAGVAKGPTAAGITATEAAYAFGIAIDAYAGAAALRLCHIDIPYLF